jgi:hypothetical protein
MGIDRLAWAVRAAYQRQDAEGVEKTGSISEARLEFPRLNGFK